MNPRIALATAARILDQLRHDRRTIGLILVVPPALIALLKYIFDAQPQVFDRIGAPLVGLFPLVMMFIITSIAMLRERTSGTLERLMSMPLARVDLLLGYGIAFAAVAAVQALVTAGVAFGLLGIGTDGPVIGVIALAVINALLGMSLGLFFSAFASSEFQAVQFMPAVILPQVLLAGLFVPRPLMPDVLEAISYALPFSYAYEALDKVAANDLDGQFWLDVSVVLAVVLLALVLGAATLRRRTG